MKKLFVFMLSLVLCLSPFCAFSQIWEGEGGIGISVGENDGDNLPSVEPLQESLKTSTSPTPPTPESEVYGFRIRQLVNGNVRQYDNDVEYADDAIGMTPIASEPNEINMNLGSWSAWIDEHFTPVMLKSDGTEDYELSRTDQNYRADGETLSDIANTSYDGNAMVRVKKFYLSMNLENEDGTPTSDPYMCYVHVKISDVKKDDTYTCYGFIDSEGNECDYAYFSMYEGSLINSKLRSISGQTVYTVANTATESVILAAKANGSGWNIDNLALYNAIKMAHVLVTCNVRTVYLFGRGGGNTKRNTGMSNNYAGFVSTGSGADRSYKTYWIENFWGGYSADIVNGLYIYKLNYSSVSTFSYRLQEPYDDLSLYSATTKGNISFAPLYGFSSVCDITDNFLLPYRNGSSNYEIREDSDGYYSFDQTTLSGSLYYNHTTMMVVGGSMHYTGATYSSGVGYFALGNVSTLADFQKARLTYLPQPSQ